MRWVILFLLIAVSVSALDVHGEFRAGRSTRNPTAFSYVRLEFVQVPVTLYGGWRTWFMLRPPSGYPFRDIYDAGLRFDWRNLFVDMNHFCNHAVWSPALEEKWLSNVWGETITTISVGVRW